MTKATINITQMVVENAFRTAVRCQKDFFSFILIRFLKRPLRGDIEYSPEASLSNVSWSMVSKRSQI